MVVKGAVSSDTFKVTTPSPEEICLTRLFAAPRRLVFEALTRPEHVKRWWGCLEEGYSVPVCEIDLRVGGKWRFVNRMPDGVEVVFRGEYREITPPSRLVYTETMDPHPEPGSLVTNVLTEEGDRTRLTVTARYPSQEVRDIVMGTGMDQGAATSYDRLEDLVLGLQHA